MMKKNGGSVKSASGYQKGHRREIKEIDSFSKIMLPWL